MTPPEPRPAFDRISLRRLVRIRWVAVAGQALALVVVPPVTVAATILSRPPVIALAIFAVAIITALGLWHVPLPWSGPPPEFPPQLVLGIWTALVVATVFISSYTWSVAAEARRLR